MIEYKELRMILEAKRKEIGSEIKLHKAAEISLNTCKYNEEEVRVYYF